MSLLQPLGTGQGFLKAGFLGFGGGGKTYTAALLAIGTRKFFGLEGPIAMFDSEGGSEYVAPLIKRETGLDLVGVKSRSLDDLIKVGREAESGGVSVLIVDSMTHVWREVCAAYLKQVNDARKRRAERMRQPFSAQTRLEFQDWGPIKDKFAVWTDLYLNSRLHVVICGRAGYEYDYEERADGTGKDLVKTGLKMKTEGEFGFEPSLLVEMERIQNVQETGGLIVHRATVIKDRFNVLDGQSADNPTFEFFRPYLEQLTPGAHSLIDTEVKSDVGVNADGDDGWQLERKRRVILCEEIQGLLMETWPGQTAEAKQAKAKAVHDIFGTRSWTAVESRDSQALRDGLAKLRQMVAPETQEEPTPEVVPETEIA